MENGITFVKNKKKLERNMKINALVNTMKRWVWKDTNHSIGGDNNITTITPIH